MQIKIHPGRTCDDQIKMIEKTKIDFPLIYNISGYKRV